MLHESTTRGLEKRELYSRLDLHHHCWTYKMHTPSVAIDDLKTSTGELELIIKNSPSRGNKSSEVKLLYIEHISEIGQHHHQVDIIIIKSASMLNINIE
jgi:hypothetical protein